LSRVVGLVQLPVANPPGASVEVEVAVLIGATIVFVGVFVGVADGAGALVAVR